ncbi:MAG: hypothetical protein ACLFPR_07320, partial [Desulfococcaceae bacterium]
RGGHGAFLEKCGRFMTFGRFNGKPRFIQHRAFFRGKTGGEAGRGGDGTGIMKSIGPYAPFVNPKLPKAHE